MVQQIKYPDTKIQLVLKGKTFQRPPCWLMRQAGRYLPEYREIRKKHSCFNEFMMSTSDVVEVTLQPLKRFDLDAAIIFSDILVIPMMLGQEVRFLEQKGPQLSVISNPEEIYKLQDDVYFNFCYPQYDAMTKVRSMLSSDKSMIGFVGGPWTVASYMLEGQTSKSFSKIKNFAYKWPSVFNLFLERLADISAEHLINQIKAGADVVKIFDSWAGSVPYNKINDWIITPHKRIISRLRQFSPEIPIISFPKGLELSLEDFSEKVDVNCIALSQNVNLEWAKRILQPRVALQGAIDPQALVVGGDTLKNEVYNQIETLGKGPYIFNLGHGITPETPPENVSLLIKFIEMASK